MKPKKKKTGKYRPLAERWKSDGDMSDAFTIEGEEKEKTKGDELASGNDANVSQLDVERGGDLFGGTDENRIP